MMGKRATALAVALAVLLPAGGWAAEVQFQLGTGFEWDSNVDRGRGSGEDDFIFQIRPKFRFLEEQGKARWNMYYEPAYEKAFETDRIDDVRHFFRAKTRYHVSEATELWLHNSFRYSEEVNTITAIDDGGNEFVSTGDAEVLRNDLVTGVTHMFTPRTSGTLSFSHRVFETDLFNRSENQTFGGTLDLRYLLTPRHTTGLGVAVSYQDYDASPNGAISASNSLFVNMFAQWAWQLDQTTEFMVRGGPTYVDNDQDPPPPQAPRNPYAAVPDPVTGDPVYSDADNCDLLGGQRVLENSDIGPFCNPTLALTAADQALIDAEPLEVPMFSGGIPPGLQTSDWTFFAEVSLAKQWRPDLLSRLTYERAEDTASGLGGSAVRDEVALFTSWRLSQHWDTAVRAGFTRRQSTEPVQETLYTVVNDANTAGGVLSIPVARIQGLTQRPQGRQIDTDRYSAAWRLTRRITKHLSVSTRYTYVNQDSKSQSPGASSDFDAHLVTLNVQYDFDKWTVW